MLLNLDMERWWNKKFRPETRKPTNVSTVSEGRNVPEPISAAGSVSAAPNNFGRKCSQSDCRRRRRRRDRSREEISSPTIFLKRFA
jgi:hypothetical protein